VVIWLDQVVAELLCSIFTVALLFRRLKPGGSTGGGQERPGRVCAPAGYKMSSQNERLGIFACHGRMRGQGQSPFSLDTEPCSFQSRGRTAAYSLDPTLPIALPPRMVESWAIAPAPHL